MGLVRRVVCRLLSPVCCMGSERWAHNSTPKASECTDYHWMDPPPLTQPNSPVEFVQVVGFFCFAMKNDGGEGASRWSG